MKRILTVLVLASVLAIAYRVRSGGDDIQVEFDY